MTKIEIIKSKDSHYLGFTVSGHSGYADSGEDIICAAISFSAINTINSIEKFTNDKALISLDEAGANIKCIFNSVPGKDSELLIKAFELGMKSLADKNGLYGEFVNFSTREV